MRARTAGLLALATGQPALQVWRKVSGVARLEVRTPPVIPRDAAATANGATAAVEGFLVFRSALAHCIVVTDLFADADRTQGCQAHLARKSSIRVTTVVHKVGSFRPGQEMEVLLHLQGSAAADPIEL